MTHRRFTIRRPSVKGSATSAASEILPYVAVTEPLERRTLLSGLSSLAAFSGGDGANPQSGLVLSAGILYGTTQGGAGGFGEVFSLPVTGGSPTALASFIGTDGANPEAGLILVSGILYGTTEVGGANNDGEVFSLPITGGTPTILASFDGTDGAAPQGQLSLIGSTLFGTTSSSGANGHGNVFSLPITGGTPTVLGSFAAAPVADLTISGSTIFGETSGGGANNDGEVFSLPITGGTPTALASFSGPDGQTPLGGLAIVGSTLFGTTFAGGVNADGTVFSLPVTGGTPTVLSSFDTTAGGGKGPEADLTAVGSALFGTTALGGANSDGSVFSIPLTGGTPTILASFSGPDGQGPAAPVTFDSSGDLFGTTFDGGNASLDGTVFELTLPASQLAFGPTPLPAVPGAVLGPPVTVDVEDINGSIVTSDNSLVTLAIASGPAGAVLGGTTSVAAVNGVATFTNLSVTTPGTYTLSATDGALATAVSGSFTISAPVKVGGLDPTFGVSGIASHNVGFNSTAGEIVQSNGDTVIAGTAGSAGSESFGVTRYNADGTLDTSFGDNGVANVSFGGDDQASGVALLPNGDILLAGTDTTESAGQPAGSQFALAAFTPAGILDTSFGGGTGEVLTSFSASAGALSDDVVHGLAVGRDGTIYVVGSSDAGGHGTDFAIAAYNDNGAADGTFNGSGRELLDFAGGSDSANAAVVQPNGELVVAGSTENTSTGVTSIALARLFSSGALDSHFGTKGQIITSLRGVADVATSVALEPKGQIVVGGVSATGSFSAGTLAADFAVLQYTTAGKLDRTFNHSGFNITSFGQDSAVTQVLVQSDGTIIASGKAAAGFGSTQLGIAVARYTTKGTLDSTFNGGRTLITLSGQSATISLRRPAAIEPLDTQDTLRQQFDGFLSNAQGIIAATPGGNLAIAGNSGGFTEEGQLVAIGVDLAASLLAKLPASLKAGASVSITISVKEAGSSPASGVVTVQLFISGASSNNAGETQLYSKPQSLKLKASQSKSFKLKVKLPVSLRPGEYDFVADVKIPASLRDLNASNNIAFKGPAAIG